MNKPTVLVTGGTGYIGSFTCLSLLENGYDVIVVDNLHNSSAECLSRIETLCGKKPVFFEADLTDEAALNSVFHQHPEIQGVVHFAAFKSVGESSEYPLKYYENNIVGTLNLLKCMTKYNVRTLVFSSSATVYGDVTRLNDPSMLPIPEECPIGPTNTYGQTKAVAEIIIRDHFDAENEKLRGIGGDHGLHAWNAALLRYFNPVGAHESGLMGEDPRSGAMNLLPVLSLVATGKMKELKVFGDDYATHDGTMIRDFVHVQDVSAGHIAALSHLQATRPGVRSWNLGSGTGTTVLEMRRTFMEATGAHIPYTIVERRPGDVMNLTASPRRAAKELKWQTKCSVEKACIDLWKWVRHNPGGYSPRVPNELLVELKSK